MGRGRGESGSRLRGGGPILGREEPMASREIREQGILWEPEGRADGRLDEVLSTEFTTSKPLHPASRATRRTPRSGPLQPPGDASAAPAHVASAAPGAQRLPPGAGSRCGGLSGPSAAGTGSRGGRSVQREVEMDSETLKPGFRRPRGRTGGGGCPSKSAPAGNKHLRTRVPRVCAPHFSATGRWRDGGVI